MKVSIVGTAGVPAAYGGFETLADNIVRYNQAELASKYSITVFCSGEGERVWRGAELVHIKVSANGAQSVVYDFLSLGVAIYKRAEVILVLGVSGALFLPLVKLVSRAKLVVNVDGIEWKRAKWGFCASHFLKLSEWVALRYADAVIADNPAVKAHLETRVGRDCHLIAYGGDHAVVAPSLPAVDVPKEFYFSVCRIEPENNVEMILQGFAADGSLNIVFVGNWSSSQFGIEVKKKYSRHANIVLLDPIYDVGVLSYFRTNALGYIHGHSAGGTNPALVEAMHFGRPVFAFDCSFNRETTDGHAHFFGDADQMVALLRQYDPAMDVSGEVLKRIAEEKFTWGHVARQYFSLFDNVFQSGCA